MAVSPVRVVAGILIDNSGRILISQRPDDGRHGGGLWEFPGGKIQADESRREALSRELDEELGIRVDDSESFMRLTHDYPERRVAIDFRLVRNWVGAVSAREQQGLAWLFARELDSYELLPADAPVISELVKLFPQRAFAGE